MLKQPPNSSRRLELATGELTGDNLEQQLSEKVISVIDFWAPWCGPCRQFGPIYEEVSENHDDILFGKVNTEEEQELAAVAGITSIPTLMIFREQIPVFSHSGAIPAAALEDLIKQVRALDMDDVRKQAAEAAQQSGHAAQTATQKD